MSDIDQLLSQIDSGQMASDRLKELQIMAKAQLLRYEQALAAIMKNGDAFTFEDYKEALSLASGGKQGSMSRSEWEQVSLFPEKRLKVRDQLVDTIKTGQGQFVKIRAALDSKLTSKSVSNQDTGAAAVPSGAIPGPVKIARFGCLFTVAVIVVLFLAPIVASTKKEAIVVCVTLLVLLVALNVALDRHYGIGKRSDSPRGGTRVASSQKMKTSSGTQYFSVHCPYCGGQQLYAVGSSVFCDNQGCPNGKNPVDIDRYNLRRLIFR